MNKHYHFYYIKDLLGNIRETYVHPVAGYKECIQRMQYYPSGLPWAESAGSSEHPWKYNGKEFVEMHGLDEYDSKARWYYPAICRTTTMDPLAEKYYPTSPYAWCGNNPVRNVDPDGMKIIIGDSTSQVEYISGQDCLEDNGYIAEVYSNLSLLKQDHPDIALMINELEESSFFHYIKPISGFNQVITNTYKNKNHIPQGTIIEYNPWNWMTVNEDIRPPRIGLVHELKHAWDANAGQLDNKMLIQGVPISELNAIRVKNLIRAAMNEPLRKTFKSIIIDEKYLK